MTALSAYGIRADLPAGFEGRIYRHSATDGDDAYAVAQFATFALPADAGDFGAGAVQHLTSRDIFAVLLEYGPESADRRLFAGNARPRALEPRDFARHGTRSGHAHHSGGQWFFVEAGRPFTLHVVLGSHVARRLLIPRVNALLAGLTIETFDHALEPLP
jgi:hypothetical protein